MTGSSPAQDPLVGRTLRGYEIQERIGVSRWGRVYRAFQKTTSRMVAIRILSREVAALPGKTDQFLEESRAEASLVHPHLVTVYEGGQSKGTYFCAMEYMDGPPLPQFLRKEGGVNEHHLLQTIVGTSHRSTRTCSRQPTARSSSSTLPPSRRRRVSRRERTC
jgi:serine/threonine protein kinase